MKHLLMILLAVSINAHADQWTGPDKSAHMAAGMAVSALAMESGATRAQAAMLGAAVGLAKEARDATGKGQVSAKDAIVTALAGAAAAYIPVRVFPIGKTLYFGFSTRF